MKTLFLITLSLILSSCYNSKKELSTINTSNQIICSDYNCQGTYTGPEFINGSDLAHQFSNTMSTAVGDQLKTLYDLKKYSIVDFNGITMATLGMGSGQVTYQLIIPFKRVNSKCEALTSFDHVGSWNHKPELSKRKSQLQKALLAGDSLIISDLKTTSEGLQEHWIQWRNKDKQKDCVTR